MGFDKVILGKDCVYSTDCRITGLNNNVLVIGGSGSGKTMSVAEARLLEAYNSSIVLTVSKRSLADIYGPVLEGRGYRVMCLDFATPDKSTIGWDPMACTFDEEDIAFLAEALVKSEPRKKNSTADPYWELTAISLLASLIAFQTETKEKPSFSDVLSMVDLLYIEDDHDLTTTSMDKKFDTLARRSDPHSYCISLWKSFRQLPIRTSLCVASEMRTSLDKLFTRKIRQLLKRKDTVDFARIGMEKTALIIVSSPVNPALNRLISVFYAQLLKELFEFAESRQGGLPVPVHFIFDDFATGGRILNFPEMISSFREAGMSCMLLLQSESQLESMYGEVEARCIIDNCDSMVFMGSNDLESAEHAGKRADLPAEEMLWMPLGREYVFRRGEKPTCTQRYNTPGDPRSQAARSAWTEKAAGQTARFAGWADTAGKAANKTRRSAAAKHADGLPTQSPTPEKRTTQGNVSPILEDLIKITSELADSYGAAGKVSDQADKLEELADYCFQLYGQDDPQALDQVQSISFKLAEIGAHQRAERLLNRLYPLRVRVDGAGAANTLKLLAMMTLNYETLGDRKKASVSLEQLKAIGERRMPDLVQLTEEKCQRIRGEKS